MLGDRDIKWSSLSSEAVAETIVIQSGKCYRIAANTEIFESTKEST